MISSVLFIPAAIYSLAAVVAAFLLSRTSWNTGSRGSAGRLSVAVVVAARDEETKLGACLSSLQRQDQSFKSLNFIVVDDNSVDRTRSVAESFAANDGRFVVTSLPDGAEGKAAALAHGISLVDADIVVTTDADCTPPPRWLGGIVSLLVVTNYDIVSGPTVISATSFAHQIQRIDWLLLFGLAGAFSAAGMPITAMGNNMAIRRDAYDAVGGYQRFTNTATEDYALFRSVNRLRSGRARVAITPDVVNHTDPEPTLRATILQRKRWARGGLDAAWWVWLLYSIVWGAHALAAATIIVDPVTSLFSIFAILAADVVLLLTTARRIDAPFSWTAFLPFELFKFIYVLTLPGLLLLRPRVIWKGKSY